MKLMTPLLVFLMLHAVIMYSPVLLASFDEDKYVDGEVFTPVNGEFDFRKFSASSPQNKNFTTFILSSGFAQFASDKDNITINVFEWDKMTFTRCDKEKSNLEFESNNSKHYVDGVCVIERFFPDEKFYTTFVKDPNSNTEIYIVSMDENRTVELAKSIKFKDGK